MSDLLIRVVPALCMFVYAAFLFLKHAQKKQRVQNCTEMVTARILDVGRIKQRYGCDYYYRVRYVWQGEKITAQFRTVSFMGEKDEETVLYIDPQHPQKCRVDCDEVTIDGNLMMGFGVAGAGVVWLIAGLFYQM